MLFFGRCPSAILLTVAFVVVSPIERVVRGWRVAHVLKEILDGFQPTRINCDASSPVVVIVRCVLVGASLDHRIPDPVDASVAEAMLCEGSLRGIPLGTAARSRVTRSEVATGYNPFSPALAPAPPARVLPHIGRFLQHSQAPIDLPDEI